MFSKTELEHALQIRTGIQFEVETLVSTAVGVRPLGIQGDTPGFSVFVERRNFRMYASVVLDAFGGQLRSAIRAGIVNNPSSLTTASRALASAGWQSQIRIDDDLVAIAAYDEREFVSATDELVQSAVDAITILSEFVLSHFVLTKPLEFRPSTPRGLSLNADQSEVWEYDPSERDRSTIRHRMLENWLIEQLKEAGLEPLDPVRGPQFDVGWQVNGSLVVCEVKSTGGDEVKQIRLGLGQVLHYRAEARKSEDREVLAALMIEKPPEDELFFDLCEEVNVRLFWPNDAGLPYQLLGKEKPA